MIELKDVKKEYSKGVAALNGINLKVEQGEFVFIVGDSGSGKSTLIKLINGLLTATEGEILINGSRPGPESKSVVSYLPERTYFQNSMKVSELISFFTDFYQDFRPERAKQMLSNLGISEDARLKTLSKGTKEKVQLVLVMARHAALYLLDEPIGGVDPATRDYILDTIISQYHRDSTILISTHLIADVEPVLDDFIFLQYGTMVVHAPVAFVREQGYESLDDYFRRAFRC